MADACTEKIIEPLKCICGNDDLEIEHRPDASRMTCVCGVCGPWVYGIDLCYLMWNDLVSSEKA